MKHQLWYLITSYTAACRGTLHNGVSKGEQCECSPFGRRPCELVSRRRNHIGKIKIPRQLAMGIFILGLSTHVYADSTDNSGPCQNSNPYSQQTCERLQQSSDANKKAQEDAYQKGLAKNLEDARKKIEGANKKAEDQAQEAQTSAAAAAVPDWQKALGGNPAQNQAVGSNTNGTPSPDNSQAGAPNSNTPPSITPLPPPDPTQFSTPKSVTLPGGINVIPTKPQKNTGNGNIQYY